MPRRTPPSFLRLQMTFGRIPVPFQMLETEDRNWIIGAERIRGSHPKRAPVSATCAYCDIAHTSEPVADIALALQRPYS